MSNQGKSKRDGGTRNPNTFRLRLWREIKRPLLVGLPITLVTCPLIFLAFGTTERAIFLMATIVGAYLATPFLMLAAGYLLGNQNYD